MTYIEGYTSKRAIRRMLENYAEFTSEDRRWVEVRSPSIKTPDGVHNTQLNKIMIDQAISKMPEDVRNCVINRWFEQHAVRHTTNLLSISVNEYYINCDKGVDLIYQEFNKDVIGAKNLLNAILEK